MGCIGGTDKLFVGDNVPGNQLFHDLVGSTINRLHTRVYKSFSDWVFPHVAPTSVHLEGSRRQGILEISRPDKKIWLP